MRERPILFSAPMVRAILDGRKTQTRRLARFKADAHCADFNLLFSGMSHYQNNHTGEFTLCSRRGDGIWEDRSKPLRCPYGQPRDRLWVRETWAPTLGSLSYEYNEHSVYEWDEELHGALAKDAQRLELHYRADGEDNLPAEFSMPHGSEIRWRPSIHMPRWASRIMLEITGVRVERLQALTDDDAIAEGAFFTDYGRRCLHDWSGPGECPADPTTHALRPGWSMVPTTGSNDCLNGPRWAFANTWNRMHGAFAWDLNPWVWVVEFRRIEEAEHA